MTAASVDLMPPRPSGSRRATPLRTAQVEDEVWLPARRIAAIRGESLSRVMRAALVRYVARHRHLLDDAEDE